MINLQKILSQVQILEDEIDIPTNIQNVDNSTVNDALQIVFAVLGAVAMLIIVIAGMQYSLSRGNPEKTGKARNAIIYAAVGLVIAFLAFGIVRYVVREAG